MTDRSWLWVAALLYLTGFALGIISLLRERKHSRAVMYLLVSAGFTVHTFGLYLRGLEVKGCPIGNTFEIFQFIAWSCTSLFLVIGATFRLSLLGFFTSCLSAALTLISLLIPSWDSAQRISVFGGNPWIELHAALAIFSYGVFGLLCLTSVMYLLQLHSLKKRDMRGLFSFLPSIIALDQINLRLLITGTLLNTTSLAIGAVYWREHADTVNIAKIALTASVWAAYSFCLTLRLLGLLISKRLAWASILLFAAALASTKLLNSSRSSLAPTEQKP